MSRDLAATAARLRHELAALERAQATVKRPDTRAAIQSALDSVRHDLGVVDQVIGELRSDKGRLQETNKARTIIAMPMDMAQSPEPRRRGRPLVSNHPFPRALEERGLTIAAWARKHRVDRAVVKSWFAPPPAGRRIPIKAAMLIEKELDIPATAEVWINGIR